MFGKAGLIYVAQNKLGLLYRGTTSQLLDYFLTLALRASK